MAHFIIEAWDRTAKQWGFDGVCIESVDGCAFDTEAEAEQVLQSVRTWTGWENGRYRIVEISMGSRFWPGYTVVRNVSEYGPTNP